MRAAAIVLSDGDSLTGVCNVFYRTPVPEDKYGGSKRQECSSDPRIDSPTLG